jgi:type IV secretion system protein TrbL
MPRRQHALLLLACVIFPVSLACKERVLAEQESRPLPAPEPPAAPSSPTLRDDTSKKRAAADDGKDAPKVKRPATAGGSIEAAGTGGSASAGSASGGSASSAGAATAGGGAPSVPILPSSMPVLTAPSAACLARCQTAMQGCLSAPVDGGVPGFGNLDLCKKAFEACQAACK